MNRGRSSWLSLGSALLGLLTLILFEPTPGAPTWILLDQPAGQQTILLPVQRSAVGQLSWQQIPKFTSDRTLPCDGVQYAPDHERTLPLIHDVAFTYWAKTAIPFEIINWILSTHGDRDPHPIS